MRKACNEARVHLSSCVLCQSLVAACECECERKRMETPYSLPQAIILEVEEAGACCIVALQIGIVRLVVEDTAHLWATEGRNEHRESSHVSPSPTHTYSTESMPKPCCVARCIAMPSLWLPELSSIAAAWV